MKGNYTMKRIWHVLAAVVVLLAAFPVGAADIGTIVEQAKANSTTVKTLQLNKQQSELALGLNDLDKKLAVVVDGSVKFDDSLIGGTGLSEANVTVNPRVTVTLPNDQATTITVVPGPIVKSFESNAFSASPSATITHTLDLGPKRKTQNDLDDLKLSKQRLEVDYGYVKGIIAFENSVYQKIIELLTHEKNILSSNGQILTQKNQMATALTLKTMSKESTSYRNMELSLARLETSLAATERKLNLAKAQYRQITGLPWDGLDAVPEADLTFTPMESGDTSVVVASLALEIAKLDLALYEQDSSAMSVRFNGGVGMANANNINANSLRYNIDAGATLSSSHFTVGSSVTMGISNTGTLSPSLTISGSWKNDTAIEADTIARRRLQNAVELATIDQQEAMLDYLDAVDALQGDILNHQITKQQLQDDKEYDERLLAQAQERLTRGLGVQSDVDNARLTLEIDAYELKINRLEALVLANKIRLLRH